jgi:hypothetical protein
MKLRLWSQRSRPEPEPPVAPEPAPEPPVAPEPAPPAPEGEPPVTVSLTLEQAKEAIRAAKGDVIQVGFLAGDYKRNREEDPASSETAVARAQLCELIATRLRDRKLLAPDGVFELREGA